MPTNGLTVYKVLIASNVIANKKPKIFTTFVKIFVGLRALHQGIKSVASTFLESSFSDFHAKNTWL